jgi:hypothetical protein
LPQHLLFALDRLFVSRLSHRSRLLRLLDAGMATVLLE